MSAPSDRELDAQLAEKALGCKVEWTSRYEGDHEPYCDCHPNSQRHGIYSKHVGLYILQPYKSAPTWATTGQLWEGLQERHPTWNITFSSDSSGWLVNIEDPERRVCLADEFRTSDGPLTFALAACRALGLGGEGS